MEGAEEFENFHCVLSLLSYLLKAPMVPPGTPVVNALAAQRQAIVNVFRACLGLPAEDFMLLEHKVLESVGNAAYYICLCAQIPSIISSYQMPNK